MATFENTVVIRRPTEEVFGFLADFERRWLRAAGTMAPVFVPKTITQGSLPEICQKLRYT